MFNHHFRRLEDRRFALMVLLAMVGGLLFAALCAGLDDLFEARAADAAGVPLSEVPVTEPRLCATVAVYTQATADDWSQRAVIAQAALNARADCSAALAGVVGQGFEPLRWKFALDAVDAVASGSYPVPLACARVNAVVPTTAGPGHPLAQAGARAQCVIRDLAFVEVQS